MRVRQILILNWNWNWKAAFAGGAIVAVMVWLVACTDAPLFAQEPLAAPAGGEIAPLPENLPTLEGGESDELEYLGRGPIHEAFAGTYNNDPVPGMVVEKAPPEPIEELPPAQKPDGDNVEWIPGYWMWDEPKEDFIWISGVWRNIPPDQRWVPGYWTEVDGGHQWIAGFWTDVERQELEYLPTPPASLEQGANVDPPGEDYFWVPGNWVHQDSGYAWRAGYWTAIQQDWIWVPARYVWTPRGCIFVSGYWDYRLPRRGVLFAPVYYRSPIYTRLGYYYTPRISVNIGPLLIHMFIRPRYHHYYYGDYYGYGDFRPWYDYYGSWRHGYDPLYSYYQWHYRRRGHSLSVVLGQWHNYYRDHRNLRPPHTYVRYDDFARRHRDARRSYVDHALLAQDYRDRLEDRRDRDDFRFVNLSDERRREMRRRFDQLREIEQQRARLESPGRRLPDVIADRDRPNRDQRDRDRTDRDRTDRDEERRDRRAEQLERLREQFSDRENGEGLVRGLPDGLRGGKLRLPEAERRGRFDRPERSPEDRAEATPPAGRAIGARGRNAESPANGAEPSRVEELRDRLREQTTSPSQRAWLDQLQRRAAEAREQRDALRQRESSEERDSRTGRELREREANDRAPGPSTSPAERFDRSRFDRSRFPRSLPEARSPRTSPSPSPSPRTSSPRTPGAVAPNVTTPEATPRDPSLRDRYELPSRSKFYRFPQGDSDADRSPRASSPPQARPFSRGELPDRDRSRSPSFRWPTPDRSTPGPSAADALRSRSRSDDDGPRALQRSPIQRPPMQRGPSLDRSRSSQPRFDIRSRSSGSERSFSPPSRSQSTRPSFSRSDSSGSRHRSFRGGSSGSRSDSRGRGRKDRDD